MEVGRSGSGVKICRRKKCCLLYSTTFPWVFFPFLAESMHYLSLTLRIFAVVIKVRRGGESHQNPQLYSGALRVTYYSLMDSIWEPNTDVNFDVSSFLLPFFFFLPFFSFFWMKKAYRQTCTLPGPILLPPSLDPSAVFMHKSSNWGQVLRL